MTRLLLTTQPPLLLSTQPASHQNYVNNLLAVEVRNHAMRAFKCPPLLSKAWGLVMLFLFFGLNAVFIVLVRSLLSTSWKRSCFQSCFRSPMILRTFIKKKPL
ncbi:hypothetical protein RND81_13G081600 [Saponaria officinalis]|uniref:Uncharacterized protein n=1 Tax=Saponaria officinalis TaxID=3572 RepID=A0AAW1H0U4_SAPOF